MPRMTARPLAAALLLAGVAACGTGPAAAPRPVAEPEPMTFTTELAPLPPQAAVPSITATLPLPTTAAPVTTAAAPAAAVAPVARGTAGRTSCRAVAHIGDSTSVGMTSKAVIPDARRRLDAQYARVGVTSSVLETSGGRSVVERLPGQQNGFEVAARLRAGGFSGCWVIALGTCDAANVAKGSRVTRVQRIERMMSVAGRDPVLWVDVGTEVTSGVWANRHMEAWNQDLVATVARYPNARIYRATAQMQPAWFASDGIHYTSTGYASRASLVADALAATFPA